MKYLLIVFLICTGLTKGYGQAKDTIPVPVFKESKAIDSFLDIVLKFKQSQAYRNRVKGLIFNRLWLSVFKENDPGSFIFQVEDLSEASINKNVNNVASRHLNFGYFQYKKENIFVSPDNNLDDLFAKTPDYKSFSFIYVLANTQPADPLAKHGGVWFYRYKNGAFSDVLPVVIPSKN